MRSEEIELEIVNFIEKNPGKTINKVAQRMSEKGISSRMTTLKKIDDLKSKERGIIEDRKEGNSFHRLHINDQNEFKRIDNELSEIEMNVLRMRDNFIKFQELYHEKKHSPRQYDNLQVFLEVQVELMDLFLHTLLLQINNNVKFETDKQLLYAKIIKLMVVNDRSQIFKDLHMTDELLRDMGEKMNSEPFRAYAKEIGMKLSVMENFISMADDFRKRYLTIDDFTKQLQSLIPGNRNNY